MRIQIALLTAAHIASAQTLPSNAALTAADKLNFLAYTARFGKSYLDQTDFQMRQ